MFVDVACTIPMASNGRNCVTTSEGMTKEQVMPLSLRKRFLDSPDIIRALQCGKEELTST